MASFGVTLSYRGKTVPLTDVTTSIVPSKLYENARSALNIPPDTQLKLLYKGKRLDEEDGQGIIFSSVPSKTPKILVMASAKEKVGEIRSRRSDPTIRGFDQERRQKESRIVLQEQKAKPWGDQGGQNKDFKFCRQHSCSHQSFGHRPTEATPHQFQASQLLDKLATDPGIVAIMKERELVVGTLGEMDPIDDRLMQKKEAEGACLLGYNTNHGLRIDIKLRTDDLSGFRPYPQLVTTLIHELSHNWVGDHNLLFWTNYAQMRAEYLYTHARLRSTIVNGKTTAALAGLSGEGGSLDVTKVYDRVMEELIPEMNQHGLHPNMISAPIRQRCEELLKSTENAQRLGGNGGGSESTTGGPMSPRQLALLAAEKRAREHRERKDPEHRH